MGRPKGVPLSDYRAQLEQDGERLAAKVVLHVIDYAMAHMHDNPDMYYQIHPEMEKDQIDFFWPAFDALVDDLKNRAGIKESCDNLPPRTNQPDEDWPWG